MPSSSPRCLLSRPALFFEKEHSGWTRFVFYDLGSFWVINDPRSCLCKFTWEAGWENKVFAYKWQACFRKLRSSCCAVRPHIPLRAWAGSVCTFALLRCYQRCRGDRELPHSSTGADVWSLSSYVFPASEDTCTHPSLLHVAHSCLKPGGAFFLTW